VDVLVVGALAPPTLSLLLLAPMPTGVAFILFGAVYLART
jgi:hypothetical protein